MAIFFLLPEKVVFILKPDVVSAPGPCGSFMSSKSNRSFIFKVMLCEISLYILPRYIGKL